MRLQVVAELGAGDALAWRDEDRVLAGDGAEDERVAGLVDRVRKRGSQPGRGADHDEVGVRLHGERRPAQEEREVARRKGLEFLEAASLRHAGPPWLALQTAKWGMQSRATDSPLEALRWLEAGDAFDIAILDMHMPEMDGVALAREIRQRRPAVPLVLFKSV